jgi:hypothetical protein
MNMLLRGNCKGKTESTIYVKSWWEICLQGIGDPLENIQSIFEAHLMGRRHTEKNPHRRPLEPISQHALKCFDDRLILPWHLSLHDIYLWNILQGGLLLWNIIL